MGEVTVLGLHVRLSAVGVTRVPVPALGEVDLKLSQHSTTSDSAAATAIELDVGVNPLALNVATVHGKIVLADVSCTKGSGSGGGSTGGGDNGGGSNGGATGGGSPSAGPSQGLTGGGSNGGVTGGGNGGSGGSGAHPSPVAAVSGQPAVPDGSTHLAETGSSSSTPLIAGAAVVILGAGGAVLALARRRRRG
ncbi:hypothetical protein DN069_02835 [Streptacidiphilus pinicola]|uniref:Gram-positive cocci surface proteins LPxTG domain-containing protein n=1 Tax=Streptacidiphilus pinicola TaxID=2219663 RepID=A0A2X0KDN4_9ACTN|nr:hypothetical protein DN069_02835 [Streptacidiphilus pinicola]